MLYIEGLLKKSPVIPAVKSLSDIQKVPDHINAILILDADILYVEKMIDLAVQKDLIIFLHIDLFKGISRDEYGIRYLARKTGIDGIVSTKGYLIKMAREENLIAIQRLFIIDSSAFDKTLRIIEDAKPDMIEILPGLVYPRLAKILRRKIKQPLIAGGMITNKKDVEDILQKGATAISSSDKNIWKYKDFQKNEKISSQSFKYSL
ncbi:glycerol-3-phosphate responsive antiterminator [Halanaerobium hydrogeniformans]|uniref:Glycerol-3-phosphate responsive antiterminator, GlpP n=1 Tax=Halanaerobium hydrogeniformans TaxID=656519 RepID=E4RPS6_HALHG|nr:glycerol-3-phosphate responsive antiterminator [Halanaerobium hydrogeniformans]ADQ13960.1 glycerol-3-phosphate responsive antiterminator, GlpP [Halanaerobium hydrogeniformans]